MHSQHTSSNYHLQPQRQWQLEQQPQRFQQPRNPLAAATAAAPPPLCCLCLLNNPVPTSLISLDHIEQQLSQLKERCTDLIDCLRAISNSNLLDQFVSGDGDDDYNDDGAADDEMKTNDEYNSKKKRSHQNHLPPLQRAPILQPSALRSFFLDCQNLHIQLSFSCTFTLRLYTQMEYDAYCERQRTIVPDVLPKTLAIKPATRYLLQYLPLLPQLCTLICPPFSVTNASVEIDLLYLSASLITSFLDLQHQLYIRDFVASDVGRLLPIDEARKKGINSLKPNYTMLTHLHSQLTNLDDTLSYEFFDRTSTICASRRYSIVPASLHLPTSLIALATYMNDIRSLIKLTCLAEDATPRTNYHSRVCNKFLSHLHELLAPNSSTATGVANPLFHLLPNSYFFQVCHLFNEEIDQIAAAQTIAAVATTAASTSSIAPSALSPPFSPEMLQLLEALILHTCANYEAYHQQPLPDSITHDIDPSDLLENRHFNNHGADYLLHYVYLHQAHILAHLPSQPPLARLAFYAHLPDSAEKEFLRMIRMLRHDLQQKTPNVRMQLMDERLRSFFGVVSSAPSAAAAASGPNADFNHLSAHLKYCLTKPLTIECGGKNPTTTIVLPTSSQWQHHASYQLYAHMMSVIERLAIDSKSDLSIEMMHWLNCAMINQLQQSGQHTVQVYPSSLRHLASSLLAFTSIDSNANADRSVMLEASVIQVWEYIQSLTSCITESGNASNPPPAAPIDTESEGSNESKSDVTDENTLRKQELQSLWLLLGQFRHWLDSLYFLSSQSHESTFVNIRGLTIAIDGILAYVHAPLRTSHSAFLRTQIASGRIAFAGDRTAIDAFLADMRSASKEMPYLRMHIYMMLLPCIQKMDQDHVLARLMEDTKESFRPRLYDLLLRHITRWVSGAIITLQSHTLTTRTFELGKPMSLFLSSIPLFLIVDRFIKNDAKAKTPLLSSSSSSTDTTTKTMHALLQKIFTITRAE